MESDKFGFPQRLLFCTENSVSTTSYQSINNNDRQLARIKNMKDLTCCLTETFQISMVKR